MKNIHILPTDKPSRLFTWGNKLRLGDFVGCPDYFGKLNKNIYITSDEEIKEGDYGLDTFHKEIRKFRNKNFVSKYDRKIILTTDDQLIKDGVQAIDDNFLEWFVKNPSCEYIRVKDIKTIPSLQLGRPNGHLMYEIIIPKEEPKQENDYTALLQPVGTKQETLEEFLKKELEFTHDSIRNMDFDLGFKTGSLIGAKWQQEQDKKLYSEKEVYNIVEQAIKDYGKNQLGFFDGGFFDPIYYNLKKWFEEFKKK